MGKITLDAPYEPGDVVWIMFENKPREMVVSHTKITSSVKYIHSQKKNVKPETEKSVTYSLCRIFQDGTISSDPTDYSGKMVFDSKEQLLNSL